MTMRKPKFTDALIAFVPREAAEKSAQGGST